MPRMQRYRIPDNPFLLCAVRNLNVSYDLFRIGRSRFFLIWKNITICDQDISVVRVRIAWCCFSGVCHICRFAQLLCKDLNSRCAAGAAMDALNAAAT